MDLDQANEDLCVPIICGKIDNQQVNLAIYNDTGIDFDSFYFDIGGTSDSVGFLPLQQYSCWYNFETLNTEYFLASAVSEGKVFKSDTVWRTDDAKFFNKGVFVVEVTKIDEQFFFDFVEEYNGDCKDLL